MKPAWYTQKHWLIVIHALIWVGLFTFPFLLRPHEETDTITLNKTIFYLLGNLCWVILFYLNAYHWVPRYLTSKKTIRYILILLVAYVLAVLIQALVFKYSDEHPEHFKLYWHFFINFFVFLFFIATSIAYRLILDKNQADNLVKDIENEHLKTELTLLRSQASPHFLFNVLNNMVALARKKSDLLEPSLIKLSSLIRYTVYDTLGETVPIENEIEYLKSYIDLQQQRFGSNVLFNVQLSPPAAPLHLEPMLLIPFVENAIKHGTGFIENAAIDIRLDLEADQLHFRVKNRYSPLEDEIKDKTSGIGLANVKRRLNLLYPNAHQLLIEQDGTWFSVDLQIYLHKL